MIVLSAGQGVPAKSTVTTPRIPAAVSSKTFNGSPSRAGPKGQAGETVNQGSSGGIVVDPAVALFDL